MLKLQANSRMPISKFWSGHFFIVQLVGMASAVALLSHLLQFKRKQRFKV